MSIKKTRRGLFGLLGTAAVVASSIAGASAFAGTGAVAAQTPPAAGPGGPGGSGTEDGSCTVGGIQQNGDENSMASDAGVSVYAGRNFSQVAGAELEGRLVVNGDATFTGGYSLGWVGGGSGLAPVVGADGIRVGGNLTVNGSMHAQTADGHARPALAVKVGGTYTGGSRCGSWRDLGKRNGGEPRADLDRSRGGRVETAV